MCVWGWHFCWTSHGNTGNTGVNQGHWNCSLVLCVLLEYCQTLKMHCGKFTLLKPDTVWARLPNFVFDWTPSVASVSFNRGTLIHSYSLFASPFLWCLFAYVCDHLNSVLTICTSSCSCAWNIVTAEPKNYMVLCRCLFIPGPDLCRELVKRCSNSDRAVWFGAGVSWENVSSSPV